MRSIAAGFALAISMNLFSAAGQVATPRSDQTLSSAARSLASLPFDENAPITIRGRVATLVWPEASSGMILIEAGQGGEKYAFSTAGVPAMAKQGFTRFALQPGAEVIVTGVLASAKAKIGPGFNAARANLITKNDGSRLFDRSRLPQ
ncbi:MAG: hypothetical protein JO307_22090 [Bryobacterales bacterium]|nr:hypothetical protein [Bryobacterales bacterium]MBV9397794.1 hypothetical protein [Bryobacterales bacterium]